MANCKSLFTAFLLMCILATARTSAGQTEIPFHQDRLNKLIFVGGRINGRPAVLLIDCGASITVVDARVAEISDWDLHRAKFNGDGPGLAGEAAWADAIITLDSTEGQRRHVAGMNLDGLTRRLGRHIDGVLGQDFLSQFDHVVIDFKTKKLRLYKATQ